MPARAWWLSLLLILSAPARSADTSSPHPWAEVLAAVGLTRDTLRFDRLDMANYGGQEFLLPYFDAVHQDPLRGFSYARILEAAALAAAPSCVELATLGGVRIGEGVRPALLGDPNQRAEEASRKPGALAAAVEAVFQTSGRSLAAAREQALARSAAAVPPDVAQAAAYLLRAELAALQWRARAFREFTSVDLRALWPKVANAAADSDDLFDPAVDRLMHRADLGQLLVGGIDLAAAVDRVVAALTKRAGAERFGFDIDTPLGRICLHGAQNDTYPGDRPYLLILDTGGDDTYRGGGATCDADHPASVLIDLAGNDRYIETPELDQTPMARSVVRKKASPRPTFGAGVMGYGILVDSGGNDTYRARTITQGCGVFGVGILQDRAGDDRYDAYANSQGHGRFGVGVLADLAGSDEYRCFTASQGYGGAKGFGLLVDTGGQHDLYEANDTVIDFPSAQTKDHNTSLSQGAGNGRRADYLDGHSLAGGIGALVDDGGDNTYTAGLFAQGAGYWYGMGMLASGKGNDTYRGLWYVQGSAAHFAVGILRDEGGDDHYVATHNMAQGAGHDYSLGILYDAAGNDRYEAPNLSLGSGNANGIGIFWDRLGDDTYIVQPGTTLGRASIEASGRNSIRERDLTLGIFLDTGGKDTYPTDLPWARNNALWTMRDSGAPPQPVMRGAGLDTEAPEMAEPE